MNCKLNHSKTNETNSSVTTERSESSNILTLFALLPWQKMVIVSIFTLLVLITVIGNTLVILSVLTTRRLRTVTNCYVLNLAVTDWLVGICVMPPSILQYVIGAWKFSIILCNIWISLDILLCTASILSLCAISLDRYLAVIQPLKYSKRRRSKRSALLMILVVWIIAFLITCPPLFGWYKLDDTSSQFECRYNQNKGYVVFSAMGSFFIPLSVMLYVYSRIGFVLTSRQKRMVRDAVSEKSKANNNDPKSLVLCHDQGESNHPVKSFLNHSKSCNTMNTSSSERGTFFELVEFPRLSTPNRCPPLNCDNTSQQPSPILRSPSFSESLSSKIISLGKRRNLNTHCISNHHSLRIPMRVSTSRKETKTTKTLTTVMGGFIACWLPFFCYYILKPFLPVAANSEALMIFLTWIGWINCAINPFIYASYNPDFRSAFWRLTFKSLVKKRSLTLFNW